MSLAKRATQPPTVAAPGMPCPIQHILETADKAEATALSTMLDAPWRVWPHSEIEKALEAEGFRVGTGSVGKHRRMTCKCGRV